jgi:thymidine phosphorylase
VSAVAGVVCVAKEGDAVEDGQPILELHIDDPSRVEAAVEALDGAIDVGPEPPERKPLILERIRADPRHQARGHQRHSSCRWRPNGRWDGRD